MSKKCVLTFFLNKLRYLDCLVIIGKLFHREAADLLKQRFPQVAVRVFGTHSRQPDSRYTGAVLLSVLYLYMRSLYRSLYTTGSQYRDFNTGVMCSFFRVRVIRRAALFCTPCRRTVNNLGIPYRRTFPQSRRDVTKELTSVVQTSVVLNWRMQPMLRIW